MSTKNITLIAVILGILLLGGCGCSGYNGLVQQDELVKKQWANVQSDYQRRADLIPNLVNTVKGEANFEQTTLTNVVEARAKATKMELKADDLSPEKIKEYQAAQGQLSQALGKLLMVTENYPNLRANDAFRNLQTQLEGTENRIKVSRNDFNDAVKEYNIKVRTLPTSLFAGMLGFKTKEGFAAEAGAEKAPEVKF